MWDQTQLHHAPLAMAYVPFQMWEELFCPEEALRRGTAFPSLEMPFCPKGGRLG